MAISLREIVNLKECLDPGARVFVERFIVIVSENKHVTDVMPKDKTVLFYLAKGIVLYQQLMDEGKINGSDAKDIDEYFRLLIASENG